MDPRSNFVFIVDDLLRCADGSTQYDLLRLPALLRPLLMGGLIDQVNREFKLKIRFEIGHTVQDGRNLPPELRESMVFSTVADGFDPAIFDSTDAPPFFAQRREVSRDELLKAPLIFLAGYTFTVHDLIENLGYVFGLIHSGVPKTPEQVALLEWRRTTQVGGNPVGLLEIRAVARVVHRALLPLREALLEKYQDNGA